MNFVKRGLHCQDSKSEKTARRLLGKTVLGKSVGGVVHSDFLRVGVDGSLGTKCTRNQGYQYIVVVVDYFEQFRLDESGCDMHGASGGKDAAVVVFGYRGFTPMSKRHGEAFEESRSLAGGGAPGGGLPGGG